MSALSTHLLDHDRTAAPTARGGSAEDAGRGPQRRAVAGPPPVGDPAPAGVGAVDLPTAERLNWLRAGVLGANDGIVSVAATVVGVAGAATGLATLAVAGVAALVAGALSMAAGEYVSVSSQRDAERVLRAHGVRDAEEALTNPWHAALASLVAFVVGGLVPLLAMLGPWGGEARVVATFAAVVAALVVTGTVSARLGGAPAGRAVLRNVVGGSLAMAITYGVGSLVGLAV